MDYQSHRGRVHGPTSSTPKRSMRYCRALNGRTPRSALLALSSIPSFRTPHLVSKSMSWTVAGLHLRTSCIRCPRAIRLTAARMEARTRRLAGVPFSTRMHRTRELVAIVTPDSVSEHGEVKELVRVEATGITIAPTPHRGSCFRVARLGSPWKLSLRPGHQNSKPTHL